MSLRTVQRALTLKDGEPIVLRFDHLCVYELERRTGDSFSYFVEQLQNEMKAEMSAKIYELAYHLTASFRSSHDMDMSLPQFIARLPDGEILKFIELVSSIMAEAFSGATEKGNESQSQASAPSELIGPSAFTSP